MRIFDFDQDHGEILHKKAALLLILSVATILRFYHLETPPLWFDEIFAPLLVEKPLAYIIEYITTIDNAPPFFYILTKLYMTLGNSDFILRFPSALFGVIGVYLTYKACNYWMSETISLYTSFVVAILPAHIYISRVARPYSFCFVLFLVGFIFLKFWLSNKKYTYFYGIAFVLSLMFFTVYTAIIPIIFYFFVLAIVLIKEKGIAFAGTKLILWGSISIIPTVYFIFSRSFYPPAFNTQLASTIKDIVIAFFKPLVRVFIVDIQIPQQLHAYPIFFWITIILVIIGIVRIFTINKRLFLMCGASLFAAFAFIIITRLPNIMFWHYFSMYFFISILSATGLIYIIPNRFTSFALFLLPIVSILLYFGPLVSLFYEPTSIQFGETNPEVGKAIAGLAFDKSAIVVDTEKEPIINWYVDKFGFINKLKNQKFISDNSNITVYVLENTTSEDKISIFKPSNNQELPKATLLSIVPINNKALFKWKIENNKSIYLQANKKTELDANLQDYYGHVYQLNNVRVNPGFVHKIIPTIYNEWGSFSYLFNNTDDHNNFLINIEIQYINEGLDNIFSMDYAFDGEQPSSIFYTTGPEIPNYGGPDDKVVKRVISLRRINKFKTLTLYLNMYCAQKTPRTLLCDLNTIGFRKLHILATPVAGNFMDPEKLAPEFDVKGMLGLERGENLMWRWGVNGNTSVLFSSTTTQKIRLDYAFLNFLPGQEYNILANGNPLGSPIELPVQSWNSTPTSHTIEFDAKAGLNNIVFNFSKINHVNSSMSETDLTPYTVAFTSLQITTLDGQ